MRKNTKIESDWRKGIADAAKPSLAKEYSACVVVLPAGKPAYVAGVYDYPSNNIGNAMGLRRRTLTGVATRVGGLSNSYVVVRTRDLIVVWHGVDCFLYQERL